MVGVAVVVVLAEAQSHQMPCWPHTHTLGANGLLVALLSGAETKTMSAHWSRVGAIRPQGATPHEVGSLEQLVSTRPASLIWPAARWTDINGRSSVWLEGGALSL